MNKKKKNETDWSIIGEIGKINPNLLKYKFFSFLKPSLSKGKWDKNQDQIFIHVMKQLYPYLFRIDNGAPENVDWAKVAFEINKTTIKSWNFKNCKKCREHWSNHLNPFVNKYYLTNFL